MPRVISYQLSLCFPAMSVQSPGPRDSHETYISGKERVKRKCTALALVICTKDDEDIFGSDHNCKGPDDKRDGPKDIGFAWFAGEGARVDVERTRADITVDDSKGLVGQPRCTIISMCSSAKKLNLNAYPSHTMPISTLRTP